MPKGNGDRDTAVARNGLAHAPHSFVLLCFPIPTFTCTRMHVPDLAEMLLVWPGSPSTPSAKIHLIFLLFIYHLGFGFFYVP